VPYETLARFDPASVEDGKLYAVTAMRCTFQRDGAVAQIPMPEEGRRWEGRPHTFRAVLRRRASDRMYLRTPNGAPGTWVVHYSDLVWITPTTETEEMADL
jgi:hypothetical protein